MFSTFEENSTLESRAIQTVIDQIFEEYDTDYSNFLDKSETYNFVEDILNDLGFGNGQLSQEVFEEVFSALDKIKSGTINKLELAVFIKQQLGGKHHCRRQRRETGEFSL